MQNIYFLIFVIFVRSKGEERDMYGERIRSLRTEKGLTQVALAAELGVTNGALRMWEIEKTQPNIYCLMKLSEVFNVSIDYITGLSPDRTARAMPDFEQRLAPAIRSEYAAVVKRVGECFQSAEGAASYIYAMYVILADGVMALLTDQQWQQTAREIASLENIPDDWSMTYLLKLISSFNELVTTPIEKTSVTAVSALIRNCIHDASVISAKKDFSEPVSEVEADGND